MMPALLTRISSSICSNSTRGMPLIAVRESFVGADIIRSGAPVAGVAPTLAVACPCRPAGLCSLGCLLQKWRPALDASTGLITDWNPNAEWEYGGRRFNAVINSLALSGNTVYAGGIFTSVGGQPRNRLAALDASTGGATGWNPNPNGSTVEAGG
jgi:hypothetical protein